MEKKILDACCGSRMFWFDKTNQTEDGTMLVVKVQNGRTREVLRENDHLIELDVCE